MKKKIAMSVMALAISAMAGSAFAAEKAPAAKVEGTAQMKMENLTTAAPAINLEQMAKEKGITVEELIAQLEKEGKIVKALSLVDAKIDPANGENNVPMTAIFNISDEQGNASFSLTKAISLEEIAKEKGMTVEELIAQLEKEGKLAKALPTTEAALNTADGDSSKAVMMKRIELNGEAGELSAAVPFATVIDLNQLAKEKGITVDELIAQLEKEGKITKATLTTPATKK
ncbi:hypothetical protein ACFLFF_10710 [Brevibacillus reuszeri]|uniref:hypothetical protein n=1 Tax=Brevibacillus reuszeri TaxID=54915 RepID=UPI00366B93AE